LRQRPDTLNLARFDSPRHNHLPALRIICRVELGRRLGSRHRLVATVVVTDPHAFSIVDPKVDTHDGPLASPLEFPKPLM
jgi:hypothetical protein